MISSDIRQTIDEYIKELPPQVAEVFAASDWEHQIALVSAKFRLNVEQLEVLTVETVLIVLGFAEPELFFQELKNRLGIADEVAAKIIIELKDRLLDPLQKALIDYSREDIEFLQNHLAFLNARDAAEGNIDTPLTQAGLEISDEPPIIGKVPTAPYNPPVATPQSQPSLVQQQMAETLVLPDTESNHSLEQAPKPASIYPQHDPYHEPVE